MFDNLIYGSHLWNLWIELGQQNSVINPFAAETVPPIFYLITILGIFFLLLLIPVINKIFYSFQRSFETWCNQRLRVIHIHSLEFILPNRWIASLAGSMKILRTLIITGLLLLSMVFVGNVFPGTRKFLLNILEQILAFQVKAWEAVLSFLPDLVALFVIIVITFFILKLLHFIAERIKQKKIHVSGIHPDWIDPAYQFLRFLLVAFAIVAAFPYIPGSDSPVFWGIAIFVGFLLALGSIPLVTNLIAGIVLISTRGLRVGDHVQIGDVIGDVVDRNLLGTRIRTKKNVVITIPNSLVLNHHIVNYSSSSNDKGLILNPSVTIAYEVPWRKVYQLLMEAAEATPGILKDPKPFILQTSLNDDCVSYELNAYTRDPSWMAVLYSRLHQNIQDKFTSAGIEIISPRYLAYRDGDPLTIPSEPPLDNGYTKFFQAKKLTEADTRPIPEFDDEYTKYFNPKQFFEEDTRPIANRH